MNGQHVATRPLSRRAFIQGAGTAGLGLLAGCGRLPGRASPPVVHRLGYLGTPGGLDALRPALAELGYMENNDLSIEARVSDGLVTTTDVNDVVQLPVDVIVTTGISNTLAAR